MSYKYIIDAIISILGETIIDIVKDTEQELIDIFYDNEV